MKVNIKKLSPIATTPKYATEGAACFDLHASSVPYSGTLVTNEDSGIIETDLVFEIPKDHVMLVFSRSGHGFTSDIRLANCTGIIDSDYRGSVKVKLTSDSLHKSLMIHNGDRIAQAMIMPVTQVTFEEVKELSETSRGTGGFGSTGI